MILIELYIGKVVYCKLKFVTSVWEIFRTFMKTSAHYEERYKKPFTCEICHNTLTWCQFWPKKCKGYESTSVFKCFITLLAGKWLFSCLNSWFFFQVTSALNSLWHMVQAISLSTLWSYCFPKHLSFWMPCDIWWSKLLHSCISCDFMCWLNSSHFCFE